MSKGKNQYEKERKKKSLLGAIVAEQETKGDIKGTLIETGKDVVAGVVGGAAGSAMGKGSFFVGGLITAVGHYTKISPLRGLGIGMMISPLFKSTTVSGTEKGGLEGAKERLIAFKDSMSQKLFIDKLLKKKEAAQTTSGVGEVQYFVYPNNQPALESELDFSALNRLENQIAQSAANYQKQNSMSGMGELGDLNDEGRHY